MASLAKSTRATVIPGLRYRDAKAAIEFLCNAFGFERGLIVDGPNNTIAHAQLTFGNGMIMIGSHPHEGEYGKWVRPPEQMLLTSTCPLRIVWPSRLGFSVDSWCRHASGGIQKRRLFRSRS
jgi:uncharacterized glyoxalase superfamily protein PhnB